MYHGNYAYQIEDLQDNVKDLNEMITKQNEKIDSLQEIIDGLMYETNLNIVHQAYNNIRKHILETVHNITYDDINIIFINEEFNKIKENDWAHSDWDGIREKVCVMELSFSINNISFNFLFKNGLSYGSVVTIGRLEKACIALNQDYNGIIELVAGYKKLLELQKK